MSREMITTRYKIRSGGGILLAVLLLAGILMGSCMKRKLDTPPVPDPQPETGAVKVSVSWDHDEPHPTAICYLLYREDGSLLKKVDNVTGDLEETLSPGKYRLIVYNCDAAQVEYRDMESYHTAKIVAIEQEDMQDDHLCLVGPQMVFAKAGTDQGEIFEVTAGQTTALTVKAPRLTRWIRLFFNITGLNEVQSLTGVLYGVSPGVTLCTQTYHMQDYVQLYTGVPYTPEVKAGAQPGAKAGRAAADPLYYKTTVETFDLLTRADSPQETNTLTISLIDNKNHTYTSSQDITSSLQQIINENGGMLTIDIPLNVNLVVNPATLNMSVVVTPWDQSGTGGGTFN